MTNKFENFKKIQTSNWKNYKKRLKTLLLIQKFRQSYVLVTDLSSKPFKTEIVGLVLLRIMTTRLRLVIALSRNNYSLKTVQLLTTADDYPRIRNSHSLVQYIPTDCGNNTR